MPGQVPIPCGHPPVLPPRTLLCEQEPSSQCEGVGSRGRGGKGGVWGLPGCVGNGWLQDVTEPAVTQLRDLLADCKLQAPAGILGTVRGQSGGLSVEGASS